LLKQSASGYRPCRVKRETWEKGAIRSLTFGFRREEVLGGTFEQAVFGPDFERVTVQVQRLVEALREAEVTCPGDRGHTFHSQ
jgi:hypothetical protein